MFIPIAVFYDSALLLQAVRVFKFSLNAPDLVRVAFARYGDKAPYVPTAVELSNMRSDSEPFTNFEDRAFYAESSRLADLAEPACSPVLVSSCSGAGYPQLEDFNNCIGVFSKSMPFYQAFQFEGVEDIPVSEFNRYPELAQIVKAGKFTGFGSISTYIDGELVHDCIQIISYKHRWLLCPRENANEAALYRSFFKMREDVTNKRASSERALNKRVSRNAYYAPDDYQQFADFVPYGVEGGGIKKSAFYASYTFLAMEKQANPCIAVTGTGSYRATDFSRLQAAYNKLGSAKVKLGNITPNGEFLMASWYLLYGMLSKCLIKYIAMTTSTDCSRVDLVASRPVPDRLLAQYDKLLTLNEVPRGVDTVVIPNCYKNFDSSSLAPGSFSSTNRLIAPYKMTSFKCDTNVPFVKCPNQVSEFNFTFRANNEEVIMPKYVGMFNNVQDVFWSSAGSTLYLKGYTKQFFEFRSLGIARGACLYTDKCPNLAKINYVYVDPALLHCDYTRNIVEIRDTPQLREINLFRQDILRGRATDDSCLELSFSGHFDKPVRVNVEGAVKSIKLSLENNTDAVIELNASTRKLIVLGMLSASNEVAKVRCLIPCHNVESPYVRVELYNKTGRMYRVIN